MKKIVAISILFCSAFLTHTPPPIKNFSSDFFPVAGVEMSVRHCLQQCHIVAVDTHSFDPGRDYPVGVIYDL